MLWISSDFDRCVFLPSKPAMLRLLYDKLNPSGSPDVIPRALASCLPLWPQPIRVRALVWPGHVQLAYGVHSKGKACARIA